VDLVDQVGQVEVEEVQWVDLEEAVLAPEVVPWVDREEAVLAPEVVQWVDLEEAVLAPEEVQWAVDQAKEAQEEADQALVVVVLALEVQMPMGKTVDHLKIF